jgi:hypothetical protein
MPYGGADTLPVRLTVASCEVAPQSFFNAPPVAHELALTTGNENSYFQQSISCYRNPGCGSLAFLIVSAARMCGRRLLFLLR